MSSEYHKSNFQEAQFWNLSGKDVPHGPHRGIALDGRYLKPPFLKYCIRSRNHEHIWACGLPLGMWPRLSNQLQLALPIAYMRHFQLNVLHDCMQSSLLPLPQVTCIVHLFDAMLMFLYCIKRFNINPFFGPHFQFGWPSPHGSKTTFW